MPQAPEAPEVLRAEQSGPALRNQLAETWEALLDLVGQLDPAEWQRPTACPGWSVADQVAHVVGTERLLLGEELPETPLPEAPHVRNEIGRLNEQWVLHYRAQGTEALLGDLRRVVPARLAALDQMSEEAFDAPSWTPVGQATYRRFMQIRVFDCYIHEQDVRDALGRPGHREGAAVEQALDEVVRALGVLVGKRAAAPEGCTVRFSLGAPAARTFDVAVEQGRARVRPVGTGQPTVTLQLDAADFLRLASGRLVPGELRAAGRVQLTGDEALGQRVLDNLPFTI
jgi:uncharacterized protein (TIGR03083 family)